MKPIIYRIAILVSFVCLASCQPSTTQPLKTLLITGQNNHHWQVSHQAIQQILDQSGLFQTDIRISPPEGEDMSSYLIDFSPYQLVVLDYVGDNWPEETRKNFLEYVSNGGGVVVYHAANNAFTDWKEYNEIIALGGWNNRDETSGPWVYWVDGELIRDTLPGAGGSHGKQHEYLLNGRMNNHPITQGLPAQWKHATDELYDRMRGPGTIEELLYTAYSAPETHGSGREEPLIFTVRYGEGRIFHTMLGHAGDTLEENPAMQCTGFQVTLLRGSEWAATGKVTQPVPDDFPTATTISMRKAYKE